MESNLFNELELKEYEFESAGDVVSNSFIVQRSLTCLDLNASEYKFMRKSIFTEEEFRKMHQPSRCILYTLHLDLPKNMEGNLRNALLYEAEQYGTLDLEVSVNEQVYNRGLAPVIVEDIRLANNKADKLRRYLNVMKFLNFKENRITSNFIFDNVIRELYPDCQDSNLVVEFAEAFSFYSWIFNEESPDIVGYVLEHARRLRYNIWDSLQGRVDPINACIIFHTTGNIGKLLEYGTVLRSDYYVYMDILSELLGARDDRNPITDHRIFLLIQFLYFFIYNHSSWKEFRRIWRSIPDPFISVREIYFAFGGVFPLTYVNALIEYYYSKIVEDYAHIGIMVPRSLCHLSRVSVRNNLSSNFQLPHGIDQLGVYKILINYLKLDC